MRLTTTDIQVKERKINAVWTKEMTADINDIKPFSLDIKSINRMSKINSILNKLNND